MQPVKVPGSGFWWPGGRQVYNQYLVLSKEVERIFKDVVSESKKSAAGLTWVNVGDNIKADASYYQPAAAETDSVTIFNSTSVPVEHTREVYLALREASTGMFPPPHMTYVYPPPHTTYARGLSSAI